MGKLILTILSASMLFLVSCGPSEANEDPSGTEEAPGTEVATPAMDVGSVPVSGTNYSITTIDDEPSSPRKIMKGTLAGAEVVVNYGSPSVKGRGIWGEMEAYDQVWRAGANEATMVSFSEDVMVEGEPLPAGTYSFFLIPGEGEWTAIFNSTAEQWGAFDYNEGDDVLRVSVSPEMTQDNQEVLEYYLVGDNLVMRWEKVAVHLTVTSA